MESVVHEHQTVSGVVEDVHQIIQNLKTLVLDLDADKDEATLELRVAKAGPVTAALIEKSTGVRVLDAAHHLFTLQDDREINVILYANKGRGFVAAEQHALPKGSPVDLVRVDSIYNPVLRANFLVDETRVGQRTDYDRLTVQVETNGSMTPDVAVAYAAELARKHLGYLLRFVEPAVAQAPVAGAVRLPAQKRDLLRRPIDELAELSVRSVNSLKKENIVTLADLVQRTEEQMLNIENFGIKSLEEIRQFLGEREMHFGMKLEEGEDGDLFLVSGPAPAPPAEVPGGGEEV
jgi:DNA-directed RNA polymerase subunit alpha